MSHSTRTTNAIIDPLIWTIGAMTPLNNIQYDTQWLANGTIADPAPFVDIGMGEWILKDEAVRLISLGKNVEFEEKLREECPALRSIWEEYKTMLALVKEGYTNEL